jgi:hypothetical protein
MASLEDIARQLTNNYPPLEFRVQNNTVVVIIDNVSFGVLRGDESINEPAIKSAQKMHKFYSLQPDLIRCGHRGKFAIVFPDLKLQVYKTTEECFAAADRQGADVYHDCFVERIGKDHTLYFDENKLDFKANRHVEEEDGIIDLQSKMAQ